MKKLLFLSLLIGFIFNFQVYADNVDYQTDYTLIDCQNGDDLGGVPFDSSKPYKTLNEGIEKTVDYINNNVNTGSLLSQSGIIFNIKVNCSLQKLGSNTITINFDGNNYKNYLKIQGIGDNGLIISDLIIDIPNQKGNIIFNNAKFLSNSAGYYFASTYGSMNYGVKIEDSYIKLLPGTQLGQTAVSCYWNYGTYCNSSNNPYQYIKNSTIDLEINSGYNFYVPLIIKDSKINFKNLYSSGVYDIKFSEIGGFVLGYDFDFFTLMSNEVDLGGNNFRTENTKNASFINNKFSNFNNFYLGESDTNLKYGIFINNLFENANSIDISYNRNIINNVFSGDYIDTYDIRNLRKNYKLDNLGTKGIGWIFQKLNAFDMFKLDYTSASLYKEITGQDIPTNYSSVYAIFSR
ncbi:hypothetical protein EOM39_01085 [Candidatus Gracilibacteria bacterium]|nr:hypothetical protein [Candidatus Gracilibacteria bacterium]